MATAALVSQSPRFLHELPVITEIAPGDILTFQVQIDASVFRVSWLHCGEVVHNSSRRHIKAHPNGWHELVIGNVGEADEGEYECRVEAADGQTVSSFTDVYFVQDDPPVGSLERSETTDPAEADFRGSRESGLLILIDDGSDEDDEDGDDSLVGALSGADAEAAKRETPSGSSSARTSRKKALTASEQFQGFLEEISRKDDDDDESLTLEEEDDEVEERETNRLRKIHHDYQKQKPSTPATSQGSSGHPNICDAFSDLEAPIQDSFSTFTSTISSARSSIGTLLNEELVSPSGSGFLPYRHSPHRDWQRKTRQPSFEGSDAVVPGEGDFFPLGQQNIPEDDDTEDGSNKDKGFSSAAAHSSSILMSKSVALRDKTAQCELKGSVWPPSVLEASSAPQRGGSTVTAQHQSKHQRTTTSSSFTVVPTARATSESTPGSTMSYRYTSSSYKYSSTGEEDSSSVRRSSFRSRASIDDENLMSSVSRSTRITRTLISGSDEPATTTSTISTTRRRLTSDDDDFGLSRRSFDDDSISRFSRQLAEEASDEAFSSKRTKVEMEGGITGYSTRSSKITHIDSGEVKSFETSSKQSYSSTFGSEGGDLQMLEDSSVRFSQYH